MEKTMELDLKEVFAALLRKIWVIALCAVLAASAALAYTALFVTPLYRSGISVYVNNKDTNGNGGISSSDLATSQKLVETYTNILMSDTVLDKVAEKVGNGVTANNIRRMLMAEQMGGTEAFRVLVSNPNPALAAQIANTIAEIAPGEIAKIVEGSSARIIDFAKQAERPYTPSFMKNTLIGLLAGAFLAAAVIVLQVMMDVRIKGESDLRKICDVPVLGMIPDYDLDYKKGGYVANAASADDIDGKVV